tara:strand:+ start:64 stop:1248 length:1185 start_codon:yes stop_codon:yes gene_type:complete
MPEYLYNTNLQTRTTFSQKCLPGGNGSAQRYDGHILELEDSSVIHTPNAGDRRVNPDLGAQFGDRQVGGPNHVTTVNDVQGNRGTGPSPHLITEKAFYTEIQPNYSVPTAEVISSNPLENSGQQITALRVDLTQGSTAFRAKCVVVKGTMSVVNQPIAGTAGKFDLASDGFVVNKPIYSNNIIPTIDFEHIFICQPLASKTSGQIANSGDNWPVDSDLTTVGNANPPGPGDAPSYFGDNIGEFSQAAADLGRISTKHSNYFRIRNKAYNPQDNPAANNFDWTSQELPLATGANTINDNMAEFTRSGFEGDQPVNLGGPNNSTNDISIVGNQIHTDGTLEFPDTRNINWVDFKYRFRTCFINDWVALNLYGETVGTSNFLGYAPRVAIKGTYLLI